MTEVFGVKPSVLRKDVLAVLTTVVAITAMIAGFATGVPQVAAIVGSITTAVNLVIAFLNKKEVAAVIDGLDNA